MLKDLQDLIARMRELIAARATLDAAIARVRSAHEDAVAYVDTLATNNEGYLRLIRRAAEREREIADIEAEYLTTRQPAASVALFNLESMLPPFEADVRAFKTHSMHPPSAIEVYLGPEGQRLNLRDEAEMLIVLVDEQRRARFAREFADAQPGDVRDRYQRALDSTSDDAGESWSLIRHVEAEYAHGWRGTTPASAEQIEAAKQLRRAITEAREARVPVEVEQADQALEAARILAQRAQSVHKVRPANPDHDPAIAAAWRAEEAELQQAAAS
jgi:hypothetical protein